MPPAPLGFHTWVTISLVAGSPLVSGELMKVLSPPLFAEVAVQTKWEVTVTFAAAAAALALARGAAAVKAPAAISVSKKAGRRLRGSRAQRARCCVLWSMVGCSFR